MTPVKTPIKTPVKTPMKTLSRRLGGSPPEAPTGSLIGLRGGRCAAWTAALLLCACLLVSPGVPQARAVPAATVLAGRDLPAQSSDQPSRVAYGWPTGGPAEVLEDFDPPAVVWGRGHRGVDLAAPEGSQVLSAGDGVVAFAGTVAGRPVVSVDHADGVRTTYEPVEASVSAGQAVTRGQAIGTLLAGHRGDGSPALHWGARTGPKTYVNPLRLLRPAVIRLKPLGPG